MKRDKLIGISQILIGEIIDNYEADAINLPAEMYNELKYHLKQLNKAASHLEEKVLEVEFVDGRKEYWSKGVKLENYTHPEGQSLPTDKTGYEKEFVMFCTRSVTIMADFYLVDIWLKTFKTIDELHQYWKDNVKTL